jgi:CubicO group peptidase (beta-lactamase class C family)
MNHRLTAAAVILTLHAAAPASAAPQDAPRAAAPAPTSLEEAVPLIDAGFDRWQAEAHAPGLVYGVVKDGEVIHLRGAGVRNLESRTPVGADTLFRIASMSKAFTALAILKLRDEGKVSLDAPAEIYVPEMGGWTYPTADSPRIRVRDLLNHTSGMVTDDPWADRQEAMTEAEFSALLTRGVPFARAPGVGMEYSNFGYALLGRIVTNASGRPYQDYVESEIMRPLGMTSTGFDVYAPDQARRALGYRWENEVWAREPDLATGAFGAIGGVQTSATDYAKWIAFLLSAWPARDDPETGPVRRATVREMATGSNFARLRSRPGTNGQPCSGAGAYGMGLEASTDCELGTYLSHSGGYPGYGSYMAVMPDRGVGLFAFSNATYVAPVPPLIEAAALLIRAGVAPERPVAVSPTLASAYADARAIWSAGDASVARSRLAMNFLMDRTIENWRAVLAQLKADAGECDTASPVVANGALSGTFDWTCEKGRVSGRVLLAPTTPVSIQALNLRVTPTAP